MIEQDANKFVSLFLSNLKEKKILYSECSSCKHKNIPPLPQCPSCNSTTMHLLEASNYGTIQTYTIIHYSSTQFEKETPFAVGIVEFPEGIRIMGRIAYDNPEELKIGAKVIAQFDIQKEDSSILSFKVEA